MKYLIKVSLLLFIGLTSCSTKETIEIKEHKLQATATGPLFTGVNTATADFSIKEVLPNGYKAEKIVEAKIKSVKIRPEQKETPEVLAYTALLSSPEESMNQFAFLNTPDKMEASLNIAEEQDFITEIIKDSNQTLVIDFNINEDWYEDWIFDVVIDWEIIVKN